MAMAFTINGTPLSMRLSGSCAQGVQCPPQRRRKGSRDWVARPALPAGFLLGFGAASSLAALVAAARVQRRKQGLKPPVAPAPVAPASGVNHSPTLDDQVATESEPSQRKGHRTRKDINDLLNSNKAWRERHLAQDTNFFTRIGGVHAPKYMWIGCSDARIAADRILGIPSADVFVARNVANVVANTDFNVASALQYAVNVLQVEHIMVCGHYDCGGVKAALTNADHDAPLENWLRNIRDVARQHQDELNKCSSLLEKQRKLVELNVIEQCLNLFKTGIVQKRRLLTSNNPDFAFTQPQIHAVVYDPSEGILRELDVDFKEYLSKFAQVYQLYGVD